MNKDLVSIGDVYGKMLNTFKYTNNLEEAAKPAFGEFKKTDGGPTKESGYHDALEDDKGKKPITSKKKKVKAAKSDEDEEVQITKENKKNAGKTLNNFMSKSVFDKLYNKVLKENFGQEEDALGLGDATPDAELDDFGGDDEFGDEEGGDDSVTFTLSRDVAQQLVDVLQGVLGGEEEDLGGEDEGLDFGDEGGDEFGDEGDDEFGFEEDEETQGTKELGNKSVSTFQGPTKSNKVTNKVAPKGGKAVSSVTDNTNTTEGAPPITALQGKGNQVPGSKIKVGDFFK